MKHEKISESTVARIAGNLLSGHERVMINNSDLELVPDLRVVRGAVATARAIVAEVLRTQEDQP